MTSADIPLHFASTARVDVESVEFLRQMAALVPGIIYIFNHQSMSNEYSNRSIAEMLGYDPEEIKAMGDELFATIIHPEDFDQLAQHVGALQDLATGEQAIWEYRAIRRDGTEVWLRSIETVFTRAADGGVLRHIGIAFDITAQKQAQEHLLKLNADLEARVLERTLELKELNAELEQRVASRTLELRITNRELEQLSYVAAHDLKVPINNMSSLTGMLEEARDHLPDEHVETLGWMRTVCDQASQKLEAMVDLAQANSVQLGPFYPVDLARSFAHVVKVNQREIDVAQAVVTSDFTEMNVFFLRQEVENIFQEMLSNALKYRSPDRKLHIDVRSYKTEHDTAITISDNGSGFELPRDKGKVFGLFQRAHVIPEGAGIALYSIRRMFDQIGGEIDVDSSKGVGTTFTMHFPPAPVQNNN